MKSKVTPNKIAIADIWKQPDSYFQELQVRNNEIYSRWMMGVSVATLTEEFALDRSQIYRIIYKYNKPSKRKEAKCVYPALKKWMKDNDTDIASFAKKIHISPNTIWRILRGDSCTKYIIDEILNATGLKYEELFRREDV